MWLDLTGGALTTMTSSRSPFRRRCWRLADVGGEWPAERATLLGAVVGWEEDRADEIALEDATEDRRRLDDDDDRALLLLLRELRLED